MHSKSGNIEELNKVPDKLIEEYIPLTEKENTDLIKLPMESRPAHLAWSRHTNRTLPPKLMFLAGFNAARKEENRLEKLKAKGNK